MGLREISGKAGLVMQRRRSPAKPDAFGDVIPLLGELKRAFTLDEIELCREAVKSREEWMRVCFEIGLFTGCRLRENRIPLTCIDLEAAVPTIPFPTPKDGQRKAFSIPIPSALFPLFREMKKERRRTHTIASFRFNPPAAGRICSKAWGSRA